MNREIVALMEDAIANNDCLGVRRACLLAARQKLNEINADPRIGVVVLPERAFDEFDRIFAFVLKFAGLPMNARRKFRGLKSDPLVQAAYYRDRLDSCEEALRKSQN